MHCASLTRVVLWFVYEGTVETNFCVQNNYNVTTQYTRNRTITVLQRTRHWTLSQEKKCSSQRRNRTHSDCLQWLVQVSQTTPPGTVSYSTFDACSCWKLKDSTDLFGKTKKHSRKRNIILMRLLIIFLSHGVPLPMSAKISKKYIESYGINNHEAVSAANVISGRITLLCFKFDILSVQYLCFPEIAKRQITLWTVFRRL